MNQNDERIRASDLRVGDELHLRFMGGDEYLTVSEVWRSNDGLVHWYAGSSIAVLDDTVAHDHEVDVRRRRR